MPYSRTGTFKDESNISKTYISFYKNNPSYSIRENKVSYKQIVTKAHVQDMQGKDAPGVGTYSPSSKDTLEKSPTWKVGKSRRFEEYEILKNEKGVLPVAYGTYNHISQKKQSFSKAERFKEKSPEREKFYVPGPAEYNLVAHKAIEEFVNSR